MIRPEKIDFIHGRFCVTDKTDNPDWDTEITYGTNGVFVWCGLDGSEVEEKHIDGNGKFVMARTLTYLQSKLMETGFHL